MRRIWARVSYVHALSQYGEGGECERSDVDSGDSCDAMVYLSCEPKEWTDSLCVGSQGFKFKGERNSWRAVRGVTQVKLRAEF